MERDFFHTNSAVQIIEEQQTSRTKLRFQFGKERRKITMCMRVVIDVAFSAHVSKSKSTWPCLDVYCFIICTVTLVRDRSRSVLVNKVLNVILFRRYGYGRGWVLFLWSVRWVLFYPIKYALEVLLKTSCEIRVACVWVPWNTKRTDRRIRPRKGIGCRRSNFKVSSHLFVIYKILHIKYYVTHKNFEIFSGRFLTFMVIKYIYCDILNIYILLLNILHRRNRWVKVLCE